MSRPHSVYYTWADKPHPVDLIMAMGFKTSPLVHSSGGTLMTCHNRGCPYTFTHPHIKED